MSTDSLILLPSKGGTLLPSPWVWAGLADSLVSNGLRCVWPGPRLLLALTRESCALGSQLPFPENTSSSPRKRPTRCASGGEGEDCLPTPRLFYIYQKDFNIIALCFLKLPFLPLHFLYLDLSSIYFLCLIFTFSCLSPNVSVLLKLASAPSTVSVRNFVLERRFGCWVLRFNGVQTVPHHLIFLLAPPLECPSSSGIVTPKTQLAFCAVWGHLDFRVSAFGSSTEFAGIQCTYEKTLCWLCTSSCPLAEAMRVLWLSVKQSCLCILELTEGLIIFTVDNCALVVEVVVVGGFGRFTTAQLPL